MYRCYLAPARWQERPLRPADEEAHHLRHVLRVAPGDVITLFDGEGRQVQARIVRTTGSGGLELESVAGSERLVPRPRPCVLLQCILKGNRMDLLVEKAVELGATRLVPIQSERSIVRLEAAQAEERRRRWERIAVAAARQCGTDWLPLVDPVCKLDVALRATEGLLSVVGSLAPAARPLRDVLESGRTPGLAGVALVIGPEGDLTAAEHERCLQAGVVPVTFGTRVLRAETAAFHALSAAAYAFG